MRRAAGWCEDRRTRADRGKTQRFRGVNHRRAEQVEGAVAVLTGSVVLAAVMVWSAQA